MNDIQKDFQERLKENNLICSQKDLDNYLLYGLLIESNNKYYDKSGNLIKIDKLKPKDFNINLSMIIQNIDIYTKHNKQDKRFFCMSNQLYQKYKDKNLIIYKDKKEYYKPFENELWLIYKI